MAGLKRNINMTLGVIFAVIGIIMVLSVSQSVIPDASEVYYDLANGYNSTAIGAGPAALAVSSTSWLGYVWVLLPFALAAVMLVRAFKGR